MFARGAAGMDSFPTHAKNLLIVGDNPGVRESIQSCFPPPDYHCVAAGSGQAALELLRQLRFSLVFCEIRLPDGDGVQFLRQGLLLAAQAPFLMISDSRDW